MNRIYKESALLTPATESPIRDLMDKAAEMKLRYDDVISFSAGEPDFDTPQPIKDATIRALEENKTHYASAYGVKELRDAIAERLKAKTGCCYDSENEIIVTSGAAEALNNTILSLFGAGDEVIVLTPAFITYENLIRMSGAKFVEVPLKKEENYQISIDDIKKATTDKTKGIIMNNPGNPTGAVFEKKGLEELCRWVKEKNLLIISDEIYADIVYDGRKAYSIAEFPDIKERLILISGFSKTYAMTGWRIGYIAADARFVHAIIKFHTYCSTCSPTFLQYGIANAIGLPDTQKAADHMVKEFEKRRNLVIKTLAETGMFEFCVPYGAFYILVDVSKTGMSGKEFSEKLLKKYHVAVVPADSMGQGCYHIIRIAYTCSYDMVEEGLKRMNLFALETKS